MPQPSWSERRASVTDRCQQNSGETYRGIVTHSTEPADNDLLPPTNQPQNESCASTAAEFELLCALVYRLCFGEPGLLSSLFEGFGGTLSVETVCSALHSFFCLKAMVTMGIVSPRVFI